MHPNHRPHPAYDPSFVVDRVLRSSDYADDDDPKVHFIVMPLLRPFSDPTFYAVGEVVEFAQQILEVREIAIGEPDFAYGLTRQNIGSCAHTFSQRCASVRRY